MSQVAFKFMLDDGRIVSENDIQDLILRAGLNTTRGDAYRLIGSLTCPQNTDKCGVTVAVGSPFTLKIVQKCHDDFVGRIKLALTKQSPPKKFRLVE